jgi:Family of unknown function (DUF6029)
MKKSPIFFLLLCISFGSMAQGTFSGDLMMNVNFFMRDTNIKASGNPLYDNYLSGNEGWLSLRYNIKGFTFFVRADAFDNSNLKNPTSANSDYGIGAWSVTKEMKDLSISVGTIYDQIGSGILFRSYEDRGLLIDNALIGLELKYKLTKNIQIKGFTGQQKNNNAVNNVRYAPVIKGLSLEGDFNAGKVHLVPGVGVINRTLDNPSYSKLSGNIVNQFFADTTSDSSSSKFTPVYNMYGGTVYNTLTYKNFSWYIEGSYKSTEAVNETDPVTGKTKIYNKPGNVEYTSLNYGVKGIALSLTGKRTEDFIMRTSTSETLLNGMLNWQPVVAVLRPERLISRYTPASQDQSEQAMSANLLLSPNDVTNFTLSYTNINTLNNDKLYREAFVEGVYQGMKSWIFQVGAQYMEYNTLRYQIAPRALARPIVYAVTPFADVTYRINEKKSIRAEFQYMSTMQDYGSWAFALIEFDVAPKWAISVSDMYNVSINKNEDNPNASDAGFAAKKADHYYSAYAAYTRGANRFSLAYVKQVDGINCAGGVCRYEPAFSGVKLVITSSF